MTERKLPQLRIEVKGDEYIEIREVDNTTHLIKCDVTDNSAKEHRESLRDGLLEMKRTLDQDKLTMADAENALRSFNQRGLSVLGLIFGKKLVEVARIFRSCCPTWNSSPDPINITVVTGLSRFVPLELLPIFNPTKWPSIPGDEDALRSNARRFPGFSAVIKREFADLEVSHDLILKNDPKLPLRCFVDQELPGAAAELGFFERNAHIDVEGPWELPSPPLTAEEFLSAFANYVQFADKTFKGKPRSPIDQIQHFICHCEINERPTKSFLRLSKGNEIKIFELISEIVDEQNGANPKERSDSAPLVFLNACGGSIIDPMAVTSFPRFFLETNGNRGFVGTETNVPDDFAAEFSQWFYRALLSGKTLGESIYEAKWKMLLGMHNPLGLIYTVYADPNLHVTKGVEMATEIG